MRGIDTHVLVRLLIRDDPKQAVLADGFVAAGAWATAALAQFRKRPGVEFSDCVILEVARKAGHLPGGTFDREFAELGDELVRL